MANPMDDSMKQKIDRVLDKVKEPESGLSVGEIGLVQKLRYSASKRTLYVFRNQILPSKGCCTLISNMLLETTQKSLIEELEGAFPDLSVVMVVPGFQQQA